MCKKDILEYVGNSRDYHNLFCLIREKIVMKNVNHEDEKEFTRTFFFVFHILFFLYTYSLFHPRDYYETNNKHVILFHDIFTFLLYY